jgi:hypothetical protein
MKNDGRITSGVAAGLIIFLFPQSIIFAFISGGVKQECLKNGGVYTVGQTIIGIQYKSCTYTK